MSQVTRGEFTVEWAQEPPFDDAPGAVLSRATVTKRFSGGISGTSTAHLILATTPVPGSAGYVALERVDAAVDGHPGTFVLQHAGLSSETEGSSLVVDVVPGSGTGDLAGLTGRMAITVTEAGHTYEFEYELE